MEQIELLQKKEEMLITMESLGYSPHTIKKYAYSISIYVDYLLSNNYEPNPMSVKKCVTLRCLEIKKETDSAYGIRLSGLLNKFICFIKDGYITINKLPYHYHYCYGGIADYINNFVNDILVEQLNLKPLTIANYERDLKPFNEFIILNELSLDEETVLKYFKEAADKYSDKSHKIYCIKTHLKAFFNYLFQEKITPSNLADVIPSVKYIHNKHLPSVFSSEEVKNIIEQIDRNNAYGKRAYAMILLATRYGLRASDVVSLKFQDIDWEHNKLVIQQYKTNRKVELPLLPEVGNAIIDYLKNARRESGLPFVFLNIKGPITSITSAAFYNILDKYCKLANIPNMEKRHHGPHSLRHSLASKMLQNGEALTTISSVLGHSSTQVTTVYLSIDQQNLKKCSLAIPKVHSRLYVKEDM